MGGNNSSRPENNNPEGNGREDVPEIHDSINLLLLGPIGAGKSATGNHILQSGSIFKVDDNDVSTTKECQSKSSVYHDGRNIKVVDMPGLGDAIKNQLEDVDHSVQQAVKALAETPEGYDAILVTLQFGRQTKDKEATICQLRDIYGKFAFEQYGILVVTHGDHLKRTLGKDETVEDYCSRQTGLLNTMWKECKERVVLFDNVTEVTEEKETQRTKLVTIIGEMKSKRYTLEAFNAALETRDKKIKKAKKTYLVETKTRELQTIKQEVLNMDTGKPKDCQGKLALIKQKLDANIRHLKTIKAKAKTVTMAETILATTIKKQELFDLIIHDEKDTETRGRELGELKTESDKVSYSKTWGRDRIEAEKQIEAKKKEIQEEELKLGRLF